MSSTTQYAESWLGAGREAKAMLRVVVPTGIGSGIVAEGSPWRGSSGDAGHIGGGEFSRVSPGYVDLVRIARDSTATFPFLARAEITRAGLGVDCPLIGPVALILQGLVAR